MQAITVSPDIDKKRATFFKLIFGRSEGYVSIVHRKDRRSPIHEQFFEYPSELDEMLSYINKNYVESNVWFCPQLLGKRKRVKENVTTCTNIWADLDECKPDRVSIVPSVTMETSPGRYQALWVLERPIEPEDAEDISRRIAYAHADDGADKSGWDLTQLLRVPLTYNQKYEDTPPVRILEANDKRYRPKDFTSEYEQLPAHSYLEIPFPEEWPELTAAEFLDLRKREINPRVWTLFYEEPEKDWSKVLWQLELLLFESGFTREEAFIVAEEAACNKYRRDDRPRELLWKEVCKAEAQVKRVVEELYKVPKATFSALLTDEERRWVEANPSIVEDYVEWAKTLGDAAWQYHQAGAFTILSSLLASTIRLPTSYGVVVPNLWFLILADTTLTRKTTAMDIAMDLILEIDIDCVLATDGSIEGLMTSISTRPGRASIFLRDEFSGLIEMMTKKDYYAGMAETLTKLYDGKFQKRVLRREIIEVREPILIIFAGGIRTRIYELLNYGHVSSGFIPRFIFIAAESDITKLRPLGPPTEDNIGQRGQLLDRFRSLYEHYSAKQLVKIGEKEVLVPKKWDVKLTDDAWVRYNKFEADMMAVGLDSNQADMLTPAMDRLSKSGLKMSLLLAAAGATEETVVVDETDLVRAFYYIEQWRNYTMDLMHNIGKTTTEKLLDRVLASIKTTPGIMRSQLMQNHHLSSRDATLVFETLEQRGVIQIRKSGRAQYFTPVEETK